MSSREDILAHVRRNQPAPRDLPVVPTFDAESSSSIETFRANLTRMGGKFVAPPADGNVDALIATLFPDAKVICSATPEVKGTRELASVRAPADLHDVDVGVARAAFGVAETGSVALSGVEFGINALGFLSQHLVVLLDPDRIVTNIHRAYHQAEFFAKPYSVFMTGPSATADIEGVLIHGAQGIRTMTIVPLQAPHAG